MEKHCGFVCQPVIGEAILQLALCHETRGTTANFLSHGKLFKWLSAQQRSPVSDMSLPSYSPQCGFWNSQQHFPHFINVILLWKLKSFVMALCQNWYKWQQLPNYPKFPENNNSIKILRWKFFGCIQMGSTESLFRQWEKKEFQ